VSFAAITFRIASQWMFIVVAYFLIDSVRKLLDTPLCVCVCVCVCIWQSHFSMSSGHTILNIHKAKFLEVPQEFCVSYNLKSSYLSRRPRVYDTCKTCVRCHCEIGTKNVKVTTSGRIRDQS
jgi:hypothetical protein